MSENEVCKQVVCPKCGHVGWVCFTGPGIVGVTCAHCKHRFPAEP